MEQLHALAARNRHLCALSEKIFQQLGVKDDALALELSGMGECSFDHFFCRLAIKTRRKRIRRSKMHVSYSTCVVPMQKQTGELERPGQQEWRETEVSSKVPRGLAWEPCDGRCGYYSFYYSFYWRWWR